MKNRWVKSILHSNEHSNLTVPAGYRTRSPWVPKVGDIVPRFSAASTLGPLDLFDFSEGHWTFLMNQPNAGGGVCTTELATLALAKTDFLDRNCRLISVTQESVEAETQWINDIRIHCSQDIWFPMIADPDLRISNIFGMAHETENVQKAVRKTYLLDPSLRVAAISELPLNLGRSVSEMLRILDAQKEFTRSGLATPSDWRPGDPLVIPNSLDDDMVQERFGDNFSMVAPGLKIVEPIS